MDTWSIGYWVGFGMALSGSPEPENYYDEKWSTATGCDPYVDEFGDAMYQGFQDALAFLYS